MTDDLRLADYDRPVYNCEICGTDVGPRDEAAEMTLPGAEPGEAVYCHAECGLNAGMVVA